MKMFFTASGIRLRAWAGALAVFCMLTVSGRSFAVIVLGGHDAAGIADNSGQNLNPAPFSLESYVGTFGQYLGTPIAPRYFITANHIGDGGSGGTFVYNNGTLTPTTYTVTLAATQNDLAIWKISDSDPAFSLYAPLYTGSTEVNQPLITIGRGTARGSVVNSPTTGDPVGWQWGAANPALSWGAGTVSQITTVPTPGFGGDQVNWAFNFDPTNPDTSILSVGDSGGPTFVLDPATSQYELAGINGLVDQVSANPDPNGTALLPDALYDSRDFYSGSMLIAGSSAVPLTSYASRISSALEFIDGTIVPEPSSAGLLIALGAGGLLSRRRGGPETTRA